MEEKWLKKLHTAGRLKELRMQGITKRWVINILGVIALFFVIVLWFPLLPFAHTIIMQLRVS